MKRRSFINRSAVGFTGATIASSSLASLLISCSKSDKKKTLAILGCNGNGPLLVATALQDVQNVSIKYVFDFDRERSIESAKSMNNSLGYFPGQVTEMETLFSDKEIDGVFLFLPEHWRALATVKACQAGKDVYVGFLPSHSIWEGQQMVKAAKKHKRIIQCGFSLRSTPSVFSAKEYIKSGELGQVVHVKIFSLQEKDEQAQEAGLEIPEGLDWDSWLGPVKDQNYNQEAYNLESGDGSIRFWGFTTGRMSGSGFALDLARMVIGDPGNPSSVYSYGSNLLQASNDQIPDRQVVTYDFEELSMACETGYTYSYMRNSPVIFGEVGGEVNSINWLLQPDRIEIYGTKGIMYLDLRGNWQVVGNNSKNLAFGKGTNNQSHHIQNFIDCIRNRDLPGSNIEQGYLSSSLVHIGNIAYQVGNKQLLFDSEKEVFSNNDKANSLLRSAYRRGYEMPDKI